MSKKPKLEDIPGVGPKTAESLREAGFKTVDKLAKTDPAKLASKVDGLGEASAKQIVEEAQKLVPVQGPKPEKVDEKKAEAMTAKPKAKVEKPKEEAPKETEPPKKIDLTDIQGVGPKTAESLRDAGFKTVRSLANADPEKLMAKVDGIGETLAQQIIDGARDLVPDVPKAELKKPAVKETQPAKKIKKTPKKEPKKKESEITVRMSLIDQRLLRIAKEKKRRQPKFRHEQAHRWIRVKDSWRKVRGIDSATREKYKGRIAMVSVGYRKPRAVRGIHPSLYQEVLVFRPSELDRLNPDVHAIRISGNVGMRKRQEIIRKADSMLLRVLNPGVPEVLEEEELFSELDDLEVD